MVSHVIANSSLGAMAANAAYMEALTASVPSRNVTYASVSTVPSISTTASIPVSIATTPTHSQRANGVGTGSTSESMFQIRGANRNA